NGCALPGPQNRQQNSPTIGEFDSVVVGVGIVRIHAAKAHESSGERPSPKEREWPFPGQVLLECKLGPRHDADRDIRLIEGCKPACRRISELRGRKYFP